MLFKLIFLISALTSHTSQLGIQINRKDQTENVNREFMNVTHEAGTDGLSEIYYLKKGIPNLFVRLASH